MKNFLIILTLIGGFVILAVGVMATLTDKPKMTKQQIVLECEKLSAVATNKAWSYKNCINNITNPENPNILQI